MRRRTRRRSIGRVVRLHGRHAARTLLEHCRGEQPGGIVLTGKVLAKSDARGHLQQVPERRATVLGVSERRQIGRSWIVYRTDEVLGERDTDQHGRDRLGHRKRREPMPIRSPVLVALHEDRVITSDEEPGGRVSRKVVVERAGLALVLVTQDRLGGGAEQP